MSPTKEDRLAYVRKMVVGILCDLCKVTADRVHGETSPVNDLGLVCDADCEALEFIHNLEDEFDLSLPLDDNGVQDFVAQTIDEIVAYLEERLPQDVDFLTAEDEKTIARTPKRKAPATSYNVSVQTYVAPEEIFGPSPQNGGEGKDPSVIVPDEV